MLSYLVRLIVVNLFVNIVLNGVLRLLGRRRYRPMRYSRRA